MSLEVQYGLIAHFFNLKWSEINLLPVTNFQIMLEQAINLAVLSSGGKFEMETAKDKNQQFRKEVEDAKNFREVMQGKENATKT